MGKKNVSLTIDEDIWNKAEEVLSKVGMSRSAFFEIALEGICKTKRKNLIQLFRSVSNEIYEEIKRKKEEGS
jgi:antitoxin component of RelBE/YafQ-DinJ toxin-antitoxin module